MCRPRRPLRGRDFESEALQEERASPLKRLERRVLGRGISECKCPSWAQAWPNPRTAPRPSVVLTALTGGAPFGLEGMKGSMSYPEWPQTLRNLSALCLVCIICAEASGCQLSQNASGSMVSPSFSIFAPCVFSVYSDDQTW